ncbi:response regulator [Siphonobacter sp. BAB-5385]|uniref:response regulator n=1 Tax=Siphonobacter sp. BAB-5385 TaxID=1864822 RepID=UPI0034E940C7
MPFSSKPLPLFLVIEDNEDYCSLLEWSYQKQAPACRLYFVRSAEEALRYLEDCFIKPQLILLDYDLPGMDGLDFLEHLRHSSVWKNLPIILFTSREDSQLQTQAHSKGATRFITKASGFLAMHAFWQQLLTA